MKPLASLSLDLDNEWSYLKTHGDVSWEALPSHLDVAVSDRRGRPVTGADVTIIDRSDGVVLRTQTDANGEIATADVVWRQIDGQAATTLTPHRVSAVKAGIGAASTKVSLNKNRAVRWVLK